MDSTGVVDTLLARAEFLPHGLCLVWQPTLILLHAIADILITLSYYSIPFALAWFAVHRKDLCFRWMFGGFSVFIFACGTTHLLSVVTLWQPVYWLEAWVKVATALTSVTTAALLWPLIPRALALPSPADLVRLNRELESQIAERRAAESMVRVVNADLEERVRQRTADLEGANAALLAEIERRKAVEDQRRASQRLLQSIIDNSTAVIFVKDVEGRYLLINRRYADLIQVRQEAVIGHTDHDLFPPGHAIAFQAADRQMLAAGTPLQTEEIAPQDDGPHTYISLKYPLCDDTGRPYAVCGIATDITDRKHAEETLRRAKENAELANRAKTEFLANMSHELRTPLNAIIGFSDLIRSNVFGEALPPRYRGYVEDILASGVHLLDIINDVLDLSAIEAGKQELRLEEIETRSLVEAAEHMLRPRATSKNLRLTLDLAAAPARLRVDERRFKQILVNLLSNAIKFTPENGAITLFIGSDDDGGARIVVADNGIGMDADGIANALSLFGQVDSTLARRYEGTGLGLPLSLRLAEAHGGRLEVESAQGKGTTVTVRLPPSCVARVTALKAASASRQDRSCRF